MRGARKSLRGVILCCAGVVAAAAAHAQPAAAVYAVDRTHSAVEFSISKWGFTRQTGIFRTLEGSIRMVPGRPESAEVAIRIDASSIDTRNSDRDSAVRSDDFLDVANHPQITFVGARPKRREGNLYDIPGAITIRGVRKNLVVPVHLLGIGTVRGAGEVASFETSFIVDRRDFGVHGARWSGGSAILGNEVRVELRIVARRVE